MNLSNIIKQFFSGRSKTEKVLVSVLGLLLSIGLFITFQLVNSAIVFFSVLAILTVSVFFYQRKFIQPKEHTKNFFEEYELTHLFENELVSVSPDNVEVYIIDSNIVNASVSYDGFGSFMLVTTGLLNAEDSVTEGIIAHEIGHLEKEHNRFIPQKARLIIGLLSTTSIFTVGLYVNSLLIITLGTIVFYMLLLIEAKTSRSEEYYCDTLGKTLTSEETMKTTLQTLYKQKMMINSPPQTSGFVETYINPLFDSHPPIKSRLDEL